MPQIYHKKNELFEVEFFQDKECTIPFDFTNAKDLYIDGLNGDITPLFYLPSDIRVFTPYIPQATYDKISYLYENRNICIQTLDDITPNLSKYIPEDNAVLFLSNNDHGKCRVYLKDKDARDIAGIYPNPFTLCDAITGEPVNTYKKLTIFLPHGTQAELEKANEVAKELKEKYGVEEVNLFVLHWFISEYQRNSFEIEYFCQDFGTLKNINKIITTNSTGILPVQDEERLQVIDCKQMFENCKRILQTR